MSRRHGGMLIPIPAHDMTLNGVFFRLASSRLASQKNPSISLSRDGPGLVLHRNDQFTGTARHGAPGYRLGRQARISYLLEVIRHRRENIALRLPSVQQLLEDG